ncbi:MAG: MFS transporter, partial [Rhodospirillaceae bacterium]|nr:MFS transporter [Rhodospirillaceae bacterium]
MTAPAARRNDPYAALRVGEIRLMLAASGFAGLASRALAVVVGYQVYALTKSPLALGLLGLVEAVPAIALSLYGGHVADRSDRRAIILMMRTVSFACAVAFALISLEGQATAVIALYAVVFTAGIARGFHDPAAIAFEAQVVPQHLTLNASSWFSTVWQGTAILGPALGGIAYDAVGPVATYAGLAVLYGASALCTSAIARKPKPVPPERESVFRSIAFGVRFVFGSQILVGSMALDLFAVLFGGAVALIPVFAAEILKIGATGVGLLNAAPAAGGILIMLWSTRHPPIRNAGRNLMLCVAGFGVSIIVFALSQNFVLSLAALAVAGACDGVSVVIRRAILRLHSPEHMRGRIAAVNMIFISASNELGAFESGIAAAALGTVRSVWLGGVATLLVVGGAAIFAPKLRRL